MNFSTSTQLIYNTRHFFHVRHYSVFDRIFKRCGTFYGWGRKKSGQKAVGLSQKYGTSFVLLEDGFIRSLGLGVDNSPSFSIVEDDMGIYYDATAPSRLENILNSYDFGNDEQLMREAREAIEFIREHHISKYNNATEMTDEILNRFQEDKVGRVLIIAQTAGDASLEYGMLDSCTTDDMINAALSENPDAHICLKVHPDVLSGKKKSDIDIAKLNSRVQLITQNVNPISLLKRFNKVYTKTSGMGFEALLVGCECVCFGMPFYAGWGITDDRSICLRRKRKLSVEEVFAGAYILYTKYHNPYEKKASDIFDTMQTIVSKRR